MVILRKIMFLLLITLSGCANFEIDAPKSNLFAEMPPAKVVDIQPLPVPDLPDPGDTILIEGVEYITLNKQGVDQIADLRDAMLLQTEILKETIKAYKLSVQTTNALHRAAKTEEGKANFLGEQWAATEEALAREKYQNNINDWIYKIIIVALVGL